MHTLSALRVLAVEAKGVADRIEAAVAQARSEGYSWDDIAAQLYAHGASGRRSLGELFPGGISSTTIRRTYEARS